MPIRLTVTLRACNSRPIPVAAATHDVRSERRHEPIGLHGAFRAVAASPWWQDAAVEKRPVVLDDNITIRLRAYLTIGYDHRVIDGAIADEFMQVVKKMIENWESKDA